MNPGQDIPPAADEPADQPSQPAVPQGRVEWSHTTGMIMFGALVLVLALVGVAVWWQMGSAGRNARHACQDAVADQLVAPASAQWHVDDAHQAPDGSWSVYGEVDAQNRFGALLRSDFRCTVIDGVATVDYVI